MPLSGGWGDLLTVMYVVCTYYILKVKFAYGYVKDIFTKYLINCVYLIKSYFIYMRFITLEYLSFLFSKLSLA